MSSFSRHGQILGPVAYVKLVQTTAAIKLLCKSKITASCLTNVQWYSSTPLLLSIAALGDDMICMVGDIVEVCCKISAQEHKMTILP